MRFQLGVCVVVASLMLTACGGPVTRPAPPKPVIAIDSGKSADVVLHALSLMDVGYVFGGRNPEAGVDCSGMVSLVYENATGVRLPHNAAKIAGLARPVEQHKIKPGDLVFFNTRNVPFSHVGLYIGDGRFIHAPRTNGTVRIERLNSKYFAARFEGARTFFRD